MCYLILKESDLPQPEHLHSIIPSLLVITCLFFFWLPHASATDINPINVNIKDTAPYHIHKPGGHFKVLIGITSQTDVKVTYFWEDFRGKALTKPARLSIGKTHTVRSPSTEISFYNLVIQADSTDHALPNREPGEARTYGFAILPQALLANRIANPESQFGTVHAKIADPYLPTWVKTLTWKTTSAKWWGYEMERRREAGLLELPIIVRSHWDSDDALPISPSQLNELKRRITAYFSASPTTLYWETGIEENIKSRYRKPYYWKNLESKLKVIRQAADGVNPDIKLIYQIAGLKHTAVNNFAKSRAAKFIDILSIHPYAWPDFPDPDTWHDQYIQQAKQLLNDQDLKLPIWYTEVGAVHQGNFPGGFFGYPKKKAEVTGLTPYQAVIYLIKLHVMALHAGVEKLFWYNYQDRNPEREYAENHFGLRDYWGYPKPVYAAYVHLHTLLAGKTVDNIQELSGNIRSYQFSDNKTKILVVWAVAAGAALETISLASLLPELSPDQTVEIVNPVGKTLDFSGGKIKVNSEPLFVIIKNK